VRIAAERMDGRIEEYLAALKASPKLGDQVVHHELLPPGAARFADPARPWPRSITGLLAARGIDKLYTHQAEAADLARMGRHVVLATPTASGKTHAYNLPVIEGALANPESRALYIYPLKALAQDQLRAFDELCIPLPRNVRPRAAIYDGDTTGHRRKKLREDPPQVIMTNPEMIHLSLLPHHGTWAPFLASLSFVVVDEVHTYRGVMGSHMAMVFRRLKRLCAYYGANPTFVFCSATVGNPGELAKDLTGLETSVITASGAPQGARHVVFLNPLDSPATAAIHLLRAALTRGLKTIVYAKSRKMTELISIWAAEKSGEFKEKISAYRAGFLPEERREIEARMTSGELLAVVSTSALELGIDIGALDVCILVGYPGSVMATLQRGGRVGRREQDAAVILVAGEDALDQYFMRHPEDFFSRPPESAVLNPFNPVIMARHLACAAAELPLRLSEPFLSEPPVAAEASAMAGRGELYLSADGREYVSPRKRPHHEVDLRGAGGQMVIEDAGSGAAIGTVDEMRAMRETHEGAVYLHRGQTYVITRLDIPGRSVTAEAARVGYYTRVRGSKDTEILDVFASRTVGSTRVHLGRLRVTETITGYEKRNVSGGRLLTIVPLNMPPITFETEGLWFEIPPQVQAAAEDARHHFMGGIHALEHAAIGILPLLVLADRDDFGGISTPMHPQVGHAAVFIYDGYPGGVGLSRLAFAKAPELLATTRRAIADCPCELGCPSCVHSPKCGSGNRPIAKDAALYVLDGLLGGICPPPTSPTSPPSEVAMPRITACPPPSPASPARPARFGVLDVETRRSAEEVGGWHLASRMGVSVAVLYDAGQEAFTTFTQDELPGLAERLSGLDLIVGFNIRRFDYQVLAGCCDFDFSRLPTLDMLEAIRNVLGYRLSLDSLARATLNAPKTADGLQALAWWQAGEMDKIATYCQADVTITRDLYLHGRDKGYLLFTNKAGRLVRLPVKW